MIEFIILHPRATVEHLGLIPSFLSHEDPRPAREQFDSAYQHGGGWRPMEGWTALGLGPSIQYAGDDTLNPIAVAELRGELICIYPHAWIAIFQKDGGFEVSRMD